MLDADKVAYTIAGFAAIMAVVFKVWPILKTLLLESAAFTKKIHDEYCSMRLESIRIRLAGIEAHEKEAKDAVREIWARLDNIADKMADNHASVLTAINRIGRP